VAVITAVTVCASALALGGAHVTVALIAALALLVCGVRALQCGSMHRIPGPALVFAALGAYSLLQSVPMPLGLLGRLSPVAAEVWAKAPFPFGVRATIGSISLDPGASSVEGAKWFAYAIAFWLAANFARRNGVVPIVALVFTSSLLVALATLGHTLAGATRVFGIYEPRLGPGLNHIGPFLNPNCLAGYLTLGAMCGFGLIVSSKSHTRRCVWALGTAIVIGVEALSGSRGGLLALLVGAVMFAAICFFMQRSKGRHVQRYAWAAGAGALIAAVFFATMGVRDSWFELSDRDISKLRMARWVLPMLGDFPIFGVGRGAFESTFPVYKPIAGDQIFTNPENIIAQWSSEWGIVATAIAIGFLVWQLRPARLGVGRSLTATAAMLGVGALMLQNLVDFSLELIAPMLAVTVLIGGCWGRHDTQIWRRRNAYGAVGAVALLSLAALSVCLAFTRGRSPVSLERIALRQQFSVTQPRSPAERALWSRLHAAIARQPAEPYFPRLGAVLALRDGTIEPLPWIEQALERGPMDSRTHWILAQTLYLHRHLDQALLEARLSVEYDGALASRVGATVARWAPKLEAIERAAPRGRAGSDLRMSAALTLETKEFDGLREELLRRAIRADPGFASTHRAFAIELTGRLSDERCAQQARAKCVQDILSAAATLDRLKPQSADGSEIVANLFMRTRQLDEAERLLSARCPVLEQSERVRCWKALFVAAISGEDRGLIVRSADRLTTSACALDLNCEGSLLEAGSAMARLQNWPEAFIYTQRAVQLNPQTAPLLQLAEAAQALGRLTVASRALQLAAGHARENPVLRAQILEKERVLTAPDLSTGPEMNSGRK